jgi:hypothetical protein
VVFVRLRVQSVTAGICLAALAASLQAQDLRGVVDVHAHWGPDVVGRSIDAFSLVRLAKQRGFRALVLKNHYEPTVTLAALARKEVPGIEVFGGLVLNRSVGGVNPAAVERMTRVEGKWGRVVWMPTFDAENQVRFSKESRPFVRISEKGALLPVVNEVLDLIAKNNLVLATGHSSPAEDLLLVREAKKRGVTRILVTHAALGPVMMSAAQMKEAAVQGAMIEFVGNAMIGSTKSVEFTDYAKLIREVGIEHCILSSDLGQAGNPLHPDGLEQIFAGLRKAGLSAADIERLVKANPARLLGLQ